MAVPGDSDTNHDLTAHVDSYARFMVWLKRGAIGAALVTILAIMLLTL